LLFGAALTVTATAVLVSVAEVPLQLLMFCAEWIGFVMTLNDVKGH